MMDDYISPEEMAAKISVPTRFLHENLAKRPDFPRPALAFTRHTKRWKRAEFERWLREQERLAAR